MYTILICDDDRDIVSALKIYLTSEGYRTFHAYSGLEALKVVREQEIHLILMDVMMPEMDGLQVMQEISRRNLQTQIPVFLITAEASDTVMREAYQLGVMDVISKPVIPYVVKRRVNSVVELYQARKRLGNVVDQQQLRLLLMHHISQPHSGLVVPHHGVDSPLDHVGEHRLVDLVTHSQPASYITRPPPTQH